MFLSQEIWYANAQMPPKVFLASFLSRALFFSTHLICPPGPRFGSEHLPQPSASAAAEPLLAFLWGHVPVMFTTLLVTGFSYFCRRNLSFLTFILFKKLYKLRRRGVLSGSVNIAQDTEMVKFRYPTTLDLNFAMSIIAVWPWDSLTLSMAGWSFELFHFLAALTAFLWIFWTPTPLFS